MPNFRQTALGSTDISDSIYALTYDYYLSADVNCAIQSFPYFNFDPIRDSEFYNSINWWQKPHEVRAAAAQKILDRFNKWYTHASPVERVLISIAGLTDSSEQIDNIVQDTIANMQEKYQIEFIDSDDSIILVDDYHAMRDERNIEIAIDTPRTQWWCLRLEEQYHRIIKTPIISFDTFKIWNEQRLTNSRLIKQQSRRSIFRYPDRRTRRIFNRSLSTFIKFFGLKAARNFIHGKNLWIKGEHFVWQLKTLSSYDILRYTLKPPQNHTPFQINICDHDFNRLATACVLFGGIPILEQAVAIKIWVDDDEIALLSKANIFTFTAAGRNNEFLKSFPHAVFTQPLNTLPFDDPSIDDGFNPETGEISVEYRYNYDNYEPEELIIDPNNPYHTAFECEDLENVANELMRTYRFLPHDGETLGEIRNLYARRIAQAKYERYIQSNNMLVRLVREKLFSHLDIDPVFLHYMQFPEFHFRFLNGVKAPRIENYLTSGCSEALVKIQ